MNTKEKILKEALNLFSNKGFAAVSVRDIASAVGIKASSLYNHFENKQDIFDTIIDNNSKRLNTLFTKSNFINSSAQTSLTNIRKLSDDEFFNLNFEIFKFYLEDKSIVKFRKMLELERFNDSKILQLYTKIFIDNILDYGSKNFASLIKMKIIKNNDPYILALQFYSPIFLLFHKYDAINNEELCLLKKHFLEFRHTYELKE